MIKLDVNLGVKSYPIYIGEGLLSSADTFAAHVKSSQVLIVTNTVVAELYAQSLGQVLASFNPQLHVVEDGESFKTLDSLNDVITRLLDKGFSRDCVLIALGGGVIGDLTGFAAACYQRGVDYIQVPTTLLAQVDSSVGGKTAVNHALGKNMIGAFHQPVAVISDSTTLDSLPDRELVAGLAEIIKYGLIRDAEFFTWLEDNIDSLLARDKKALHHAVTRSCQNKAEVVALDEKEQGQRALLNFGHTFGHAIETALEYRHWLHGEAIGLGMLIAADLSCRMGWLELDSLERTRTLLNRAGLPLTLPEALADVDLRALMAVDKKSRAGKLHLVLLEGIGQAVISPHTDDSLLLATLDTYTPTARAS